MSDNKSIELTKLELELKAKELEIRERELAFKERQFGIEQSRPPRKSKLAGTGPTLTRKWIGFKKAAQNPQLKALLITAGKYLLKITGALTFSMLFMFMAACFYAVSIGRMSPVGHGGAALFGFWAGWNLVAVFTDRKRREAEARAKELEETNGIDIHAGASISPDDFKKADKMLLRLSQTLTADTDINGDSDTARLYRETRELISHANLYDRNRLFCKYSSVMSKMGF